MLEKAIRKDGTLRSEYRKHYALVADYIANHKENFNYGTWANGVPYLGYNPRAVVENPCGTHCCIGGWGALLRAAFEGNTRRGMVFDDKYAADWFGIESRSPDSSILFYGQWSKKGLGASAPHVIRMLRKVAETGRLPKHVSEGK